MMRLLSIVTGMMVSAIPSAASDYRAGVASVVITPSEPMWAAGYGGRDHETDGKVHDLHAKALVLEDAGGARLVFVTTDLLGLPKTIAEPVADVIGRRFNLPREQICLTSSHTHCGPVLRDSLVDIYMMTDADRAKVEPYSARLEKQLVQVVADAMGDLKPARLAHAVGTCGFAMNRRENHEAEIVKDFKLVEGYAPKGPVDHDVPVLKVTAPDGTLRAVLFGYACHCTTLDFYEWSGDYAGFAQVDIEAAHPGATAMFFAGCGGDSNPIPRRSLELCRDYGKQLARSVGAVLDGDMKPVAGGLRAELTRINLGFEKVPTREELQRQQKEGNRYEQNRAARLLARLDAGEPIAPAYPYTMQALRLGDGLTAVALAGEVVVDYSLRLKRELGRENTWIIAYANEVFAYIPSERVLAEGGYEGESSMAVYGLPSKWAKGLEEKIVSTAHELTRKVRGN